MLCRMEKVRLNDGIVGDPNLICISRGLQLGMEIQAGSEGLPKMYQEREVREPALSRG